MKHWYKVVDHCSTTSHSPPNVTENVRNRKDLRNRIFFSSVNTFKRHQTRHINKRQHCKTPADVLRMLFKERNDG